MKMKKSIRKEIIFPLFFILLFSVAIPFTHADNGTPEMSILPEHQYAFINDTFTVDIVVNMSEVYIVQCDISFNASLIEAVSVENGDMFDSLYSTGTIDNVNGVINDIWGFVQLGENVTPVPGGVFATINFKAKDKLGIANIDISEAFVPPYVGGVNLTLNNATVEIRNYPVNLEISPSYAMIGNWTKMLDVNVGPYGNEIYVLNCNITFNPVYFEVIGVTNGGLFPYFTYSIDNTTGTVFIIANVVTTPVTTAGKLASIEFKPKQTGMSNINLTDIQVFGDGSYLYYTTQNATLVADLTPPTTDLILGEPNYNSYITSATTITLNATDDLSGVNHTYYRIWYNGSWTQWMEYISPFTLPDECTHYIEFYSIDNVSNVEEVHNVTLHVDNTPPSSTIEIGNPVYSSGGNTYINFSTPIYINASDEGLCKVGVYTIHWTIKNLTGGTVYDSGESNTNVTLYVGEECYHKVEYWVEDALRNKAPVFPQDPQYERVFYVDNSPPVTTLEIGKPYYNKGGEIYITSSTPVYLNSTDTGMCAVGSYTIYYRILIWNETAEEWNIAVDWTHGNMDENLVVYINEECKHKIEYYAVDDLGNAEEIHEQIFYVDNTPPTTTIEFGMPKYNDYITSATTITLNAVDGGLCISGINATYYRIYYNETWTDWMIYAEPFNIAEECMHVIEWYSIDNLGNVESIHNTTVYVDNTPPATILTLSGTEGNNGWYVSSVNVDLLATDYGCNGGCGIAFIYYEINETGENYTQEGTHFEFTVYNDGEYTIYYYAQDNLGNMEAINISSFKIDKTPPSVTCNLAGTYEEGKYTSDVTITITASDAKSGVQSIKYRIDEGNWLTVDGATAQHIVSQEGDHVVEYLAIDKAGNTAGVAQKTFKILKNKPPTANFDYSPDEPTDLETVQFADQSIDEDGEIVGWQWEFGDGNTSTLQNPSHRYADDGTYIVKLTVTDDKGASASKQMIIEIFNDPPKSAFTTDIEKPKINEEITFTSLAIDEDGTIVNYTWYFGDGNVSYEQNPKHAYEKEGNYTVRLIVTDDDGATDEKIDYITVVKEEVNIWLYIGIIIILIIIAIVVVAVWRQRTKGE